MSSSLARWKRDLQSWRTVKAWKSHSVSRRDAAVKRLQSLNLKSVCEVCSDPESLQLLLNVMLAIKSNPEPFAFILHNLVETAAAAKALDILHLVAHSRSSSSSSSSGHSLLWVVLLTSQLPDVKVPKKSSGYPDGCGRELVRTITMLVQAGCLEVKAGGEEARELQAVLEDMLTGKPAWKHPRWLGAAAEAIFLIPAMRDVIFLGKTAATALQEAVEEAMMPLLVPQSPKIQDRVVEVLGALAYELCFDTMALGKYWELLNGKIVPKSLELLKSAVTRPSDAPAVTFVQLFTPHERSEPLTVALLMLCNATCRLGSAQHLLQQGLLEAPLLKMDMEWGGDLQEWEGDLQDYEEALFGLVEVVGHLCRHAKQQQHIAELLRPLLPVWQRKLRDLEQQVAAAAQRSPWTEWARGQFICSLFDLPPVETCRRSLPQTLAHVLEVLDDQLLQNRQQGHHHLQQQHAHKGQQQRGHPHQQQQQQQQVAHEGQQQPQLKQQAGRGGQHQQQPTHEDQQQLQLKQQAGNKQHEQQQAGRGGQQQQQAWNGQQQQQQLHNDGAGCSRGIAAAGKSRPIAAAAEAPSSGGGGKRGEAAAPQGAGKRECAACEGGVVEATERGRTKKARRTASAATVAAVLGVPVMQPAGRAAAGPPGVGGQGQGAASGAVAGAGGEARAAAEPTQAHEDAEMARLHQQLAAAEAHEQAARPEVQQLLAANHALKCQLAQLQLAAKAADLRREAAAAGAARRWEATAAAAAAAGRGDAAATAGGDAGQTVEHTGVQQENGQKCVLKGLQQQGENGVGIVTGKLQRDVKALQDWLVQVEQQLSEARQEAAAAKAARQQGEKEQQLVQEAKEKLEVELQLAKQQLSAAKKQTGVAKAARQQGKKEQQLVQEAKEKLEVELQQAKQQLSAARQQAADAEAARQQGEKEQQLVHEAKEKLEVELQEAKQQLVTAQQEPPLDPSDPYKPQEALCLKLVGGMREQRKRLQAENQVLVHQKVRALAALASDPAAVLPLPPPAPVGLGPAAHDAVEVDVAGLMAEVKVLREGLEEGVQQLLVLQEKNITLGKVNI